MKNTIIIVAFISALIVMTVLSISFFRENPDVSISSGNKNINAPVKKPGVLDGIDYELKIDEKEESIWAQMARIKKSKNSENATESDQTAGPVQEDAAEENEPEVTAPPVTEPKNKSFGLK